MKIASITLSFTLFALGACDFSVRTGPGAQTPSPSRAVSAPPPAAAAATPPPAPASTIQTRTIKRPQIKMPDLKNGVPASGAAPATSASDATTTQPAASDTPQ